VRSPADTTFQAQFTREQWSEPYYERLRAELNQRGISGVEETVENGQSVLIVSLGQDLDFGQTVVRMAFEKVFKVPLFDRQANFERMSVMKHPTVTDVIR